MKYRKEWKGLLRESFSGFFWNHKRIGEAAGFYRAGAESPGGMVTDTIWNAINVDGKIIGEEFASKTLAVSYLIETMEDRFRDLYVFKDTRDDGATILCMPCGEVTLWAELPTGLDCRADEGDRCDSCERIQL